MNPERIIDFIRKMFQEAEGFIPLHTPYFGGNEKKYLLDTIDSTFVSSVGAYVTQFEKMMCDITGAKYAIAIVNGTAALHLSMVLAGVGYGDEVITQPLTFVATANAVAQAGGVPVFVDVDRDTMGLSPTALEAFLQAETIINAEGQCINKTTGRHIAACVPMHTFGFPARIDEIVNICHRYHITVIEDAAESLGSYYKGRHTGTFGMLGTFSFNGNKTVTCGGGGAIVTNDETVARHAKHISTTAKIPHAYEFTHDEVGYNYRMPNLNAALACAQLEQLDAFVENKRVLANAYAQFFEGSDIQFVGELSDSTANYWLNTIILPDHVQQQVFLEMSNMRRVMTRPIWKLMNRLPMYCHCQHGPIGNAEWLEARVVNIPSSVRPNFLEK
ncbi:aminotransferase, LLPSF_NHT_00031 family [Chitinophaga costaii]|uniref:GDP-perosamine synthase n=1 Tax=Chitinophaga costaii TaxID=1335309 RepID=A0A1C4F6Y7_9BACT|nr:LegC family aminotransferase [Chitinophaga costaii]PUZ21240.1 LegC family aminotransferase [Chitinophaga costaii]SCC51552.1 aminotransferase, LLPSF_NHT_00031 family [Chitinophaga costaii]